jgi:hypothetical protein
VARCRATMRGGDSSAHSASLALQRGHRAKCSEATRWGDVIVAQQGPALCLGESLCGALTSVVLLTTTLVPDPADPTDVGSGNGVGSQTLLVRNPLSTTTGLLRCDLRDLH